MSQNDALHYVDLENAGEALIELIESSKAENALRAARNKYIKDLEDSNKDNHKKLSQNLSTARLHIEGQRNPLLGSSSTQNLMRPKMGGLNRIPGINTERKKKLNIPVANRRPTPPEHESHLPVPQEENNQKRYQEPVMPSIPPQQYPPWLSMYPPQQPQTDPALLENLTEIKTTLNDAIQKNKNLEEELKHLQEESNSKINIPPPIKKKKDIDLPIPNGVIFAQNECHATDLEDEEKALLNVAAQEYDNLKMISNLDPNSELYKYKVKQYKEMSTYRADVEKALQKQRLEKINFDFDVRKRQFVGGSYLNHELNDIAQHEKLKKESLLTHPGCCVFVVCSC